MEIPTKRRLHSFRAVEAYRNLVYVLDPSVDAALLLTTTVPFILFSRPMGQYRFQQACASNAKN